MKIQTILSVFFLAASLCVPLPALSSDRDDFARMMKFYREKNYPMVKNIARGLADTKEYRYHVKLLLSEVYFQENDLYYAADILRELFDEFPQHHEEIKKRIDKVEKEKAFFSKSERDQGKRFLIQWGEGRTADSTLASEVMANLDDVYQDAGRFFGWYPEDTVRVIVYYGGDYEKYTVMPPWSQAGYDGKIRLTLKKWIVKDRLKEVIYHEYTHHVIQGMTGGNCPLWFNEAVAQYFAMKQVYGKVTQASPPSMRPDNFPRIWSGESNENVKKLYEESLNLLVHIVKKTDEWVVRSILENLGKRMAFNAALDDALKVYGLNAQSLFN